MHYKLAHRPLGAKFFRDHINHHHTIYAKDHLASETYRREAGNLTPFFLIPVIAAGAGAYFVLPPDFFVVQAAACAASFYAPVFFDREISRARTMVWEVRLVQAEAGTSLRASPSRGQQFRGHRFFFWDRVLGTFRASVKSASELVAYKIEGDCR